MDQLRFDFETEPAAAAVELPRVKEGRLPAPGRRRVATPSAKGRASAMSMDAEPRCPAVVDGAPNEERADMESARALVEGAVSTNAARPTDQRPGGDLSDSPRPAATLSEALANFVSDPHLHAYQVRDARSAVSRFARLAGRRPEDIPMSVETLKGLFLSLRPARLNFSPRSWANIKVQIRRIAAANGTIDRRRLSHEPLSEAWAPLRRALPPDRNTVLLMPLISFCSRQGITPETVDDGTVTAYFDWRRRRTLSKPLTPLQTATVRVWNRMAQTVPGWPAQLLTQPAKRRSRDEQLLDLPETFRAELDHYIARLRGEGSDPFAMGLSNPHLSPESIGSRRANIVRAATAAIAGGADPSQLRSLSDIVDLTMFRKILVRLNHEDGGGTHWRRSRATLASNLVSLARDVGVSDTVVGEMLRLAARVRGKKAPGLPEEVEERLRTVVNDPTVLHRLFTLADRLQAEARRALPERPVQAAHLHETAVMLAIVTYNPIRRRNLASLDIERNFSRDSRGRVIELHLSGGETKNGIPNNWLVPTDVGTLIDRHLAEFRPHVRGSAASSWLFPSPKPGKHRHPTTLARQFVDAIRRNIGVTANLHLMRHLVATLLYDQDPKNGPVAQRVLGHSELKATERMYGTRRNSASLRQWGALLDDQVEKLHRRRRRQS